MHLLTYFVVRFIRISFLVILLLTGLYFTKSSHAQHNASVDSLVKLLKQAEGLSTSKDTLLIRSTYFSLAEYYEQNYLYKDALEYYKKAFFPGQDSASLLKSANTGIRIASLLNREEKYAEALKYVKAASQTYLKLRKTDSLASAYIQIADVHQKLGNFASAEQIILKKALPLSGNEDRIRCFKSLGHTYLKQKKYSQAKWFFIQENMLARKMNNRVYVMRSLLYLGQAKTAIRDYGLALNDYKVAERISTSISDNKILAEVHSSLADFYKKQGDLSASRRFSSLAQENKRIFEMDVKEKRSAALAEVSLASKMLLAAKEQAPRPEVRAEQPEKQHIGVLVAAAFAVLAAAFFMAYYIERKRRSRQ